MGLTGAGGGILSVPLLVFFLGLPIAEAAPIALCAVALASSIGAILGLRDKILRYKAAGFMAIFGLALGYPAISEEPACKALGQKVASFIAGNRPMPK